MPTRTDRVDIPVVLTLRDSSYRTLTAASGNLGGTEVISSRAIHALEILADGGLQLSNEHVSKIESVTGKQVRTAQDVVNAATKPVGVEEGQHVFSYAIDPAFVEPLKERAKEIGRSIPELIGQWMDQGLRNDWFISLAIDGHYRIFSQEETTFLNQKLGPNWGAADIIKALRSTKKEANG